MVFHEMPYFLELFANNLVKTLNDRSLHKKLLLLKRSTSFDGFSQTPTLFAKFC